MSNDSLYPVGEPNVSSHQRILQLHARRLESSLALDLARNDRLKKLEIEMDKLDTTLQDIKLAMAKGHMWTRVLVAGFTLLGVVLARLLGH